jgi:FkbM family methyltransferase
MNPFLYGKKLDLVDFGDIKLLMFRDDNLYENMVSEDRKNRDLHEHFIEVAKNGYSKSLAHPDNIQTTLDPRLGLFVYMRHLWKNNIDFTVLDIGSHIGDFSIKAASFARTFKKKPQIIAFDPTPAGALVEYNARINGVQDCVRHENLAISDINGLIKFRAVKGHSDSPSAFDKAPPRGIKGKLDNFLKSKNKIKTLANFFSRFFDKLTKGDQSYEFIARSVRISDYLKDNGITGNLFVKIDIEGLDACVIRDLQKRSESNLVAIVMEFAPGDFPSLEAAAGMLRELGSSFIIYDIFYSPNPVLFERVNQGTEDGFAQKIDKKREYRYTDLLLIPKTTPELDPLLKRLDSFQKLKEEYTL